MLSTHVPTRRLGAARIALWIEASLAAFWPAAAACAALAGVVLLGAAWHTASGWPGIHLVLLGASLAGIVLLIRHGRAMMRPPGPDAAERRLERDSGLLHRPLATLRDRPASAGPQQLALWRLHQARAVAQLGRLRVRAPRPDLARHDPLALRAAAFLLLAAGLVVAGPRAGAQLAGFLLPNLSSLADAPPIAVQAWIQPPAYTGQAPVFLPAGGAAPETPISVPFGSRLTVSITGATAKPSLLLAGRKVGIARLAEGSYQAASVLNQGGRLRLGWRFSTIAGWTVALLPNEPPVASWPAPPGRAGTALSIKLPWHVQQRWGVARLTAVLQPRGRADLPAREIALPLPGTPRSASGNATPDLSADPYAGVAMTARLDAEDVSGQHGRSVHAELVLPARPFHHPLARAIADLRRRLALHPDTRGDLAGELDALAGAAMTQKLAGLPAAGVALNLSAASTLLAAPAASTGQVAEVQGRLWILALALDGALPDASARALADAQADLRHGIEDHARGKLSDKELSKKLDALRQALDKHLAELAKKAMQQGALQKFDPTYQHLSAPGVDRAIRRLEQALREGKTAEARDRMAELERMMDQLKDAHIMSPEEAREQQKQARTGRQQQGAVQDMVQRETGLLDHGETRDRSAAPPGAPPPAGAPPGPAQLQDQLQSLLGGAQNPTQDSPPSPETAVPPPPDAAPQSSPGPSGKAPGVKPQPSRQADARTQHALHRALDALKQGLTQSGRKKPGSLDDASQAMQDAADALKQGDDAQSRDAIGRAIAALQQGGQEMQRGGGNQSGSTSMQLSMTPGGGGGGGQDDGSDEPGDGGHGGKRDPFGRQVDGNGTTADDPDLRVPDKMEQGRSRAIQQELRRRGADRARSKDELDYIGRLLKPF